MHDARYNCLPEEQVTVASLLCEQCVLPTILLLWLHDNSDASLPLQVIPLSKINPIPWPKYTVGDAKVEPETLMDHNSI